MKNRSIRASLFLVCALFFGGCTSIPPEAVRQPADNALICDAFTSLMKQGKTTREQEQAFILSNRKAWHSQNFALNGVPLPEDLKPGAENVNLLDILQGDVNIRAMLQKVSGAIQPTPEQPDGN